MKRVDDINWFVVTGAPSSGKTTLLRALHSKGYTVIFEAAREIIDEDMLKGKTLTQIRFDEMNFQRRVLARKIEKEKLLTKQDTIFFERGIPDSMAYYELCGVLHDTKLETAMNNARYKKVFLLDMVPYKKDYARIEGAEGAKQIAILLEKAYKQHRSDIIKVPVMDIDKRVEFILKHI